MSQQDIIDQIEKMTVADLNELVSAMEEKFGVSAAAMVAVGGGGGDAGGSDEKSSYDVVLKDAGSQKIQVIKAIKELLGVGLKEAKDLVDGAPAPVQEGVEKDKAEEMKSSLEEAGATVELK